MFIPADWGPIDLVPVYWAIIVLLVEPSEGNTNTQTKIVTINKVLQSLLDPAETGDLTQLRELSSSINGD